MSEPWEPTLSQSMLFAVDSPVSLTLSPVADVPPQTKGTSGESSPESFARLGPDGSWLRTSQGYCQVNLDGSLDEFSGTWPRAGMTRSGTAYLQRPLVPLTRGTECGSSHIPTPRAVEWKANGYQQKGDNAWLTLTGFVRLNGLPTPTAINNTGGAAMCKWGGSGARARLRQMFSETEINGALNPTWVEWLMGYPLGWTVCEAWETQLFRKSRSGLPGVSKKRKA
jgi:hypothetical protein